MQAALKRVSEDYLRPGQAIAIDINIKTKILIENGIEVILQWVPSHIGIEGNERADQTAKEAAERSIPIGIERYSSFSYIARKIRAQKQLETKEWLYKTTYKGEVKKRNRTYSLTGLNKPDPQVSIAEKPLARRFYQLKIGHAITAPYLYRIRKSNTEKCWWCSATRQSIDHLIFECRQWVKQRRVLYSDLTRAGVERPRMSEDRPKNRLFNALKAVKPILEFIRTTDIGRGLNEDTEEERGRNRLDRWDLDRLRRVDSDNEEEENE